MIDKEAFEQVWELFLEQLLVQMKAGDPPTKPKNFIGSVEKHKEKFDAAVNQYFDKQQKEMNNAEDENTDK